MITTVLSGILLFCVLLLAVVVLAPLFYGAPWHPTSTKKIIEILKFCDAQPGEKIYDPGSGDGRVLIIAAQRFGLNGVGVEIDPLKTWVSRILIRYKGLTQKIKIFRQSMYGFDFSGADILYLYLTHQAIDRLMEDIKGQLKPGVKIICYRFCLRNITPEKVNTDKTIFLYRLNKGREVDRYS
ncbi:MAG: 50S ribosomal protein L11 methyltransferase [Nitrospinota bacterium]|nr:50S ribosomal protein L11 methyltransferase [Nitrospinota bacterium]